MRIAVCIIGLVLFVLWLPLSCINVFEAVAESSSSLVFATFLMPLLFAVGAGFVIKYPIVATVIYTITALFSIAFCLIMIISNAIDITPELIIMCAIYILPPLILSILSYLGYKELQNQ